MLPAKADYHTTGLLTTKMLDESVNLSFKNVFGYFLTRKYLVLGGKI
jgi:hypothetical protein